MTHSIDSFTGVPYIPIDYEGPTGPCATCGNPGPAERGLSEGGAPECSPCFIGRVATEIVTLREAQAFKAEIARWEKP